MPSLYLAKFNSTLDTYQVDRKLSANVSVYGLCKQTALVVALKSGTTESTHARLLLSLLIGTQNLLIKASRSSLFMLASGIV
jgi:hypothetical protein